MFIRELFPRSEEAVHGRVENILTVLSTHKILYNIDPTIKEDFMRKLDLTGQRFGRLVVLSEEEKTERGQANWLCQCDCGNQKIIRLSSLRGGESLSCGCRKKESMHALTHGMSYTPEYRVWTNMKARCLDTNHQAYHNYGARGIKVCERWLTFENFIADMGLRHPGTTLERIDNNGNYEPLNCCWATRSHQNSNKRSGR